MMMTTKCSNVHRVVVPSGTTNVEPRLDVAVIVVVVFWN